MTNQCAVAIVEGMSIRYPTIRNEAVFLVPLRLVSPDLYRQRLSMTRYTVHREQNLRPKENILNLRDSTEILDVPETPFTYEIDIKYALTYTPQAVAP
jgi:hypothetical protein